MTAKPLPTLGATLAFLAAISPLAASAAAAQSNPPPASASERDAYDRGYQAGRDAASQQGGSGYQGANTYAPPPGDYDAPPEGYDGTRPPPPPPGYQPDAAYGGPDPQDRRYEAYAEDWAQRYCVKSGGNAGAGAVIGGLLGALVGSSVAGRHDRGTGAAVGGIAGAFGGAVAGSAQSTSPGCPPGYVARGGAPAFYYDGPDYVYAAPDWYRPWIFIDNRWSYRPYPYHAYYYRTWGYGRPGYGRPGYGRPGWRGRRY
jgi:hypothetical protein